MRNRIQKTKQVIEKVSLSHLRAFQVKARNPKQLKDKYELYRHYEIVEMFKFMSYKSTLNEKRECKDLTKLTTKDTIMNVKRTVVVPTSYELFNDTVLGMYRVGKDFVKRRVEKLEVVPVIQWGTPEIKPI